MRNKILINVLSTVVIAAALNGCTASMGIYDEPPVIDVPVSVSVPGPQPSFIAPPRVTTVTTTTINHHVDG